MLAIGQSQRECCGSGRATRGWTQNDEVDSGQLFYWRAFAGGAPECQACQGACSCVCMWECMSKIVLSLVFLEFCEFAYSYQIIYRSKL